jgi:hypothetical protein
MAEQQQAQLFHGYEITKQIGAAISFFSDHLGEGKFSKVYKAKTMDGDVVAIKRINVAFHF